MWIAALQMRPEGETAANLAKIGRAAQAAVAQGAELLVAPEMATTGYAIWADIPRLAEPRNGPIVRHLQRIARENAITVVAGFPECDGEIVYNAAALVTPAGEVSIYRKCHLFGPHERAAFSAGGAHPALIDVGGMRTAMLICYDVEFPEMVRRAALAGADLVVVPTALPRGAPAARVSGTMVPTRAFENHVFVVYADLCGEENGTAYQGGSVIAAPDGESLARAGMSETLLVTQVDPSIYAAMELDPYLQDRRPDLYLHSGQTPGVIGPIRPGSV